MGNIQYQEMIDSDNGHAINSKREADEKILAKIEQMMGTVPHPIQVMAERSGIVEAFMNYRDQIFDGGL